MKSVFDKERGCGAMLVMEGGVIDQATTDTAAEAAVTAEYRPGDEVAHGRRSLIIEARGNARAARSTRRGSTSSESDRQADPASRWRAAGDRALSKVVVDDEVADDVTGSYSYGYEQSQTATALALKSVKPSRLKPETFRDAQVQLAEESAICFVIGLHPHIVSVHGACRRPRGC